MIRLVIVDDEPLVRSGLDAILSGEDDLEVVGEAGDGADVPSLVRALRPDVVLMDVRMPRIDGLQATRTLLAAADGAPKVIVLTTFGSDDYVYEALRSGAAGFLLKRSPPEEIIQAIRTVAAGESIIYPDAIRQLAGSYGTTRRSQTLARLSAREAEVLEQLAAGLNNAEIAAGMFLSSETVKSHVASLLAKLDVRDRTQAVILAYETGFIRTRS